MNTEDLRKDGLLVDGEGSKGLSSDMDADQDERIEMHNGMNDSHGDADREYVLDSIIGNLSSYKPSGRQGDMVSMMGLDRKDGLLSLDNAAAMFGLSDDFTPSQKADVLLSLAYFRSPAFSHRLLTSFGVSHYDDLSDEDKQTYGELVQHARNVYKDVSFRGVENIAKSRLEVNDENEDDGLDYTVNIPNARSRAIGPISQTQAIAHEIGHLIYNPYDGLDPGLRQGQAYGQTDSPLNSIESSEIDVDRFIGVYREIWQSREYDECLSEELDFLSPEQKKESMDWFHEFRNLSNEEMRGRTDFMEVPMEHDNLGYERAADIQAVHMIMLKEGIWNPFGNRELTLEQVREFYDRHPDSRIFEFWDLEEARFYLNSIAGNTHSPSRGEGKVAGYDMAYAREVCREAKDFLNFMAGGLYSDVDDSLQQEAKDLKASHLLAGNAIASLAAANYDMTERDMAEGQEVFAFVKGEVRQEGRSIGY